MIFGLKSTVLCHILSSPCTFSALNNLRDSREAINGYKLAGGDIVANNIVQCQPIGKPCCEPVQKPLFRFMKAGDDQDVGTRGLDTIRQILLLDCRIDLADVSVPKRATLQTRAVPLFGKRNQNGHSEVV
ncbi:hypothetical protein F5890DRAFT_1479444 [Lentinula detonsa]|uniref:Uncharacterized protein n=1 Tax=Lentinula detonsa TaxID=2804962 RepID=A0AA38UM33_9AGAR|nr:hypothetical protein F5890DRAFT_1479444 [Lentinula detonsa]